ncbi:MAG: MarR family transcriptional regulator [Pararhodobacter sp.]|nr:MarR family transcriptional regulator [Pararhodobacter sp.]
MQSADEFHARLSGEFGAVHGLSVNEFFLLMHLERATSQRLPRVELAKRMHVSGSTVTRMVAPMEKTGLVAREVDAHDARFAFVAITRAGQTKLSEARATFEKQAGYLFQDRWEDNELEQLSNLLHRLVAGSVSNLT